MRSSKELEFDIPSEAARFFFSSFLMGTALLWVGGGGDLLSISIKNLVPYFADSRPFLLPIDYSKHSERI